jgi:hypothetical protein
MMGSLVWRLSTCRTPKKQSINDEIIQKSKQQTRRCYNRQQQCGGGFLLLLSEAEVHATALTKMKSLPSP